MNKLKSYLTNKKLTLAGRNYEINLSDDTNIDINNISQLLSAQPALVAYYGEIKAMATIERDDAKMIYETVCANARNVFRISRSAQKRLSADELKDLIITMPEVVEAEKKYKESEYILDLTSVAFAAIKDRGISLNSMGSIYRTEYNVNDKIKEENIRRSRNFKPAIDESPDY